jgi:hypothetical protein
MRNPVTFIRSLALAAVLLAPVAASAQAPGQPVSKETMEDIQKALQAPFVPSHLALATDVLSASGMLTMFQNAMPNVVGALRVNVTRTRPELARDIEEVLKVVEAEQGKISADGINGAARFLAQRMNEAELKEVNTFLKSPVGQKYVATLPPFMDLVVPYLEVWSQEASGRMMTLFKDEMTKRGHKL